MLYLQGNHFTGKVDFKERKKKIKTLVAINLTNNEFEGTFPCLSQNIDLQYLDIRHNKFGKIEPYCDWNESLKIFMISYNKNIHQSYEEIAYNMKNMTVLDLSLTQIYDTLSNGAIDAGGDYFAIYDTDMSTNLPEISKHARWNQSWTVEYARQVILCVCLLE